MIKVFSTLLAVVGSALAQPVTQSLPREQWGAPLVSVTHTNGQWIIAGKKRTVVLNDSDLALEVRAGTGVWKMLASGTNDMLVKRAEREIRIRLADAHGGQWQRFDTGFKTGVKIMLNDWGRVGEMLGLRLHFTVCLEGAEEELVCDVAAEERDTVVIGYVPPDEDFNPEHPTTRTDAMRGEIELLNWSRHNLGVTATEAGSDWVIPYVDIVNQSGGVGKTVPLPLYQLVFHDAVLTTYGAGRNGGAKNLLLGILCGGVPELPVADSNAESLALIKRMAALHKRVALLEMTNHEFLDPDRKRERTTFADGTTVTVDWNANSLEIKPEL